MMPVIHIGPAALQTSTFAMILALWLGSYLAEREFARRGLRGDEAWTLTALGVAATMIAARLIYVAQNFEAYAQDWLQVFSPTPGTLDLPLGALFGVLAVMSYLQRKRLPLARVADSCVLGALVALAILALGQFLSGDGLGTATDLPWGVLMWGTVRHPVQLYEWLGVVLGLLVFARLKNAQPGLLALVTLAWYSAVRVFVDGFRAEAQVVASGYRVSQILGLAALLVAVWMIGHLKPAQD